MGRSSYLHLTTTMEVRATMARRSGRRPLRIRNPKRPWPPGAGAVRPIPVRFEIVDAVGRCAA